MAAAPPQAHYIGQMRPVGDAERDRTETAPHVRAQLLPLLVPCELVYEGSNRSIRLISLLSSASPPETFVPSACSQPHDSILRTGDKGAATSSSTVTTEVSQTPLAMSAHHVVHAPGSQNDINNEAEHTVSPSIYGASGLASSGQSRGKRNKAKGFDRSNHLNTYYVCTACGWSGSSRQRHNRRQKIKCNFTPNRLLYKMGEDRSLRVKEYLAKVTPTQREHGLAPDGELVAMSQQRDRIFLTIPEGLSEGDAFSVPIAANEAMLVTVPMAASPGQVIEVVRA